MKTLVLIAAVSILMLTGCAKVTYHGLKPIDPGVLSEVVVLRPSFKWEPSENPTDTYDLIIYEMSGAAGYATPGKTVYYREGLESAEHTIEEDLVVGGDYYWSIRSRSGDTVKAWSRYDMFAATGLFSINKKNHLFELYVTTVEAQEEEKLRNR